MMTITGMTTTVMDQDGPDLCEQTPCSPSPCQNDGSCDLEPEGPGGYVCTCKTGFTGMDCEEDIDECDESKNQSFRKSVFESNSPFIHIVHGCNISLPSPPLPPSPPPPLPGPCQFGGTCSNTLGSFSCACEAGYQGHRCQYSTVCETQMPCRDNQTCVATIANVQVSRLLIVYTWSSVTLTQIIEIGVILCGPVTPRLKVL